MKKPRHRSIGRLIGMLYRHGHNHIARQLEPYGIGRGQFVFLALLYERDGLSQDELASYLLIDKGTAARALQSLEKAGYVHRRRDRGDRRVNRVDLTARARAFEPTLRGILREWTGLLFKDFNRKERELSFKLLERMSENVKRLANDTETECVTRGHDVRRDTTP
jgi:DNA-binding MarR family transcriptional regulator